MTVITPRLYPFKPSLFAANREGLQLTLASAALLSSTLALNIVYRQLLFQPDSGVHNTEFVQKSSADSRRYKVHALQLIKDALQSPVEAIEPSIIYSVALLVVLEVCNIQFWRGQPSHCSITCSL